MRSQSHSPEDKHAFFFFTTHSNHRPIFLTVYKYILGTPRPSNPEKSTHNMGNVHAIKLFPHAMANLCLTTMDLCTVQNAGSDYHRRPCSLQAIFKAKDSTSQGMRMWKYSRMLGIPPCQNWAGQNTPSKLGIPIAKAHTGGNHQVTYSATVVPNCIQF